MDAGTVDAHGPTVVIIDDHPAIIDGVQSWCAAASPPVRVLDVGTGLITAIVEPGNAADVVVLDLQLDGKAADFDGLKRLVDAGRRVIVYSQFTDPDVVLRCLDTGAATYLTKAEGPNHLIAAIQTVAQDRPYTPPALGAAMAGDNRPQRPNLSPQEREVLLAWLASDSKQLVAQRLHLSVKTVGTYIERVRVKYAKVGRPATTKTALVARAHQDGLIRLDEL